MQKRVSCIFVVFILVLTFTMSVSATEKLSSHKSQEIPAPRYSYTNITNTSLNINSGVATCSGSLIGYQGVTTKVRITITLQKRNFLLFWSDQQSWSETFYSWNGNLVKKFSVSGGTYRVKATYEAYANADCEEINQTSKNVSC